MRSSHLANNRLLSRLATLRFFSFYWYVCVCVYTRESTYKSHKVNWFFFIIILHFVLFQNDWIHERMIRLGIRKLIFLTNYWRAHSKIDPVKVNYYIGFCFLVRYIIQFQRWSMIGRNDLYGNLFEPQIILCNH